MIELWKQHPKSIEQLNFDVKLLIVLLPLRLDFVYKTLIHVIALILKVQLGDNQSKTEWSVQKIKNLNLPLTFFRPLFYVSGCPCTLNNFLYVPLWIGFAKTPKYTFWLRVDGGKKEEKCLRINNCVCAFLRVVPVAQRVIKVCACFRISFSLSSGKGILRRMCSMKSWGVTAARFHLSFPRTISSQFYKREMGKKENDGELKHKWKENERTICFSKGLEIHTSFNIQDDDLYQQGCGTERTQELNDYCFSFQKQENVPEHQT